MNVKRLLICLFFCAACNPNSTNVIDTPAKLSSISTLPDSSIFSVAATQIECAGEYVYALDYDRHQVIRLNSTMDKMVTFGSEGRGPAELLFPYNFVVKDNEVLILDFMTTTVKYYSESGFERSASLNFAPSATRFALSGNDLFICGQADNSYQVYRVSGEECNGTGEKPLLGTPMQIELPGICHLLPYQDSLVAVFPDLPYIVVMDKNGRMMRNIDISAPTFYKYNIDWIANNSPGPGQRFILNSGACIFDDVVYILCPDFSKNASCNLVVAVDLNRGEITKIIKLPDDSYSSISVAGSYLYAFNSSDSSLDKYEIQ